MNSTFQTQSSRLTRVRMGFVVMVLGALLSGLYSKKLVFAKEKFQPADSSTGTAVLFLVDESGGVNGECGNPNQVLFVDEPGRRYELLRFFFVLWRISYAGDWLHPSQKQVVDHFPEFSIGLAHFADDYRHTLPLESVRELDELKTRYEKLLSPKNLLDVDKDWFCKTHFPPALERAQEALIESDASERVLILLTDGSFRGSDVVSPTEHARAQNDTEEVLKQVAANEIKIYVLVLGRDMCEVGDCDLSRENYDQRKSDLARWQGWEKDGYITLIDDNDMFRELGRAVNGLLPGHLYSAGWLTDKGQQTVLNFQGETEQAHIAVVLSRDKINESVVELRDENSSTQAWSSRGSQWRRKDYCLLPQPGSPICSLRSWTLKNLQDAVVYYWYTSDNPIPQLEMSVSPRDKVILSHNRQLQANVGLFDGNPIWHPNCYQVIVSVMSDLETLTKTVNFASDSLSSEVPFTITGHLPWESNLIVNAQLVHVDATDMALPNRQHTLPVYYKPGYPASPSEIEVVENPEIGDNGRVTFTVPILHAAIIPSDVFTVSFGLFPSEFKPGESVPVHKGGCYSTDPDVIEQAAQITREPLLDKNQLIYYVGFDYEHLWHPRCGYRSLRVRLQMENEDYGWYWKTWSTGAAPPTITLLPTPTSTPILPIWERVKGIIHYGIVAGIFFVIIVFVWVRNQSKY